MALKERNVQTDNITVIGVPGSFELPYAAKLLKQSGSVDVIVCVGVLIKV